MADNEIKLAVVTDISGLRAGLAEAQAQVQAAASNMADAQAAFGRAAEQGSDQAIAALAEYTDALKAAEDQLDALQLKQAQAGRSLARPQGEETQFSSWREAAAARSQSAAQGGVSGPPAASSGAAAAGVAELAGAEEAGLAVTREVTEATTLQAAANAELAGSYEDAAAASASYYASLGLGPQNNNLENQAAQQAAFSAGLERDSAALAAYEKAAKGGAEASALLGRELDKAIASGATLTEAMEAAVAAVNQYSASAAEGAAATNALASSQARGVSEMTAASTAARLATGSMFGAARGAAQFATTTLGLGPILQAAFPLIGAIALISILVDLGEKLYDVEKKANEATDAIGREFDTANQKMQVNLDDIELTNSKLQDQIDKLEHHPGNGLQTALLEAIAAADKLQEKLNADNQSLEALLKKHEVTQLTSLITGQAPTIGINKDIEDEHQKLTLSTAQITVAYDEQFRAAAGDKDKIAGAIDARTQATKAAYDRYISTLTISLNQQYALQRKNDEEKKALEGAAVTPGYGGIAARAPDVDYSPGIKTLEEQLAQAKLSQQITMASMETQPLEAKKGGLEQKKQDASLANQAREQKLKVLEQGLEDEQAVYGKSANQTAAYWDKYIGTFAYGTDQLRAVEGKLNAAREQLGKKEPSGDLFGKVHEQAKKQNEELKKDSEEYQRILDTFSKGTVELQQPKEAQQQQQATAQGAHLQEINQLEESHQKAQLPFDIGTSSNAQKQLADLKTFHQAVEQENVRFEVEQLANTPGNNTQIVAAVEKAQDQMLAAERSGDQKRIELAQQALEKEVALLVQANSKETNEMKSLQDKLTEDVHRGNMQRLQDTEKSLQQQSQKFMQAYNTMTSDLNQAISKMITSTEPVSTIFAKMFDQILDQLALFIAKWLEQQAAMWIKNEILIITGNEAAKVASLPMIQTDAAIAAANTYNATSAIPLIGPALAPAAAAVAYAAVMAFESFEAGGVVSGMHGMPVPIMAHAGERVLSAPQTQSFERMVNSTTSNSRNSHLNYSPNISGVVDKNMFKSLLNDHASEIHSIMRQGWNQGKLR